MSECLTIVADTLKVLYHAQELTFSLELHQEVVLVRLKVGKDKVFAIADGRYAVFIQFFNQLFLSYDEDIVFLEFLRAYLLVLEIKI